MIIDEDTILVAQLTIKDMPGEIIYIFGFLIIVLAMYIAYKLTNNDNRKKSYNIEVTLKR
ncbi:MAG TPA: hypothetical protein VJ845_02490 [Haploplasma sp.]|nr:hypothetical protein [Haploplasma sp.]